MESQAADDGAAAASAPAPAAAPAADAGGLGAETTAMGTDATDSLTAAQLEEIERGTKAQDLVGCARRARARGARASPPSSSLLATMKSIATRDLARAQLR